MRDLLSIGTNRRESMIGTGIGLGLAGYRLNPPGGLLPALDLWFSQSKSMSSIAGPTPSFSRASSGTYFDASGVLQSAGVNAARFNHTFNGTNWVSRGLLVEAQGTNLTTHSSDLSHADWGKFDASITTDQAIAPDSTNTADFIKEGTGSVFKIASLYYAVSAGKYTFSAYLKAGTRTFAALSLRVNNAASGASGTFDLTNGTFIRQVNDGSPTGFSYTITNVGNGWYRYSVSLDHTSGGVYAYIALSDASFPSNGYGVTLPYYVGDGTSGIYAWGAQFESGAFPTSYIGTTNSSVVRSADVCQITGSDFSGFWNGTEGTIAAEFEHGPASGDSCLYMVAGGSTDPQSTVFITGGNIESSGYNGASIYSFNLGAWSSSTAKIATAFKTNDFAASLNGGSVATDTSGTLSTAFNRLQIGRIDWGGGAYWNGHISRLRYWNTRLDNGILRVLST